MPWREHLTVGNLEADKVTNPEGHVLPGTALRTHFGFVEDFFHFTDGDLLVGSGDTAVMTETAGHGGLITLAPTAVTDEHEAYLTTPVANFKFQVNKPLAARCRIKLTEAVAGTANIIFGFMETADVTPPITPPDALQDAGAGPPADYDGAVIFKVDGGSVWQAETSVGTTQNTDTDVGTFVDDTFVDLEVAWNGVNKVIFRRNGVLVSKQTLALGTMANMYLVLGVKNGSAAKETLTIDYLAVNGKR